MHVYVSYILLGDYLILQFNTRIKIKRKRKSLVTFSSGLNPLPDDVLVRSQDKTDFLPIAMLLVLVGT